MCAIGSAATDGDEAGGRGPLRISAEGVPFGWLFAGSDDGEVRWKVKTSAAGVPFGAAGTGGDETGARTSSGVRAVGRMVTDGPVKGCEVVGVP